MRHDFDSTTRSVCLSLLVSAALGITGCGSTALTGSPAAVASNGVALHGIVHGGQQVLSNASISLYAVSQSGYKTASTQLLRTPVISDGGGGFGLSGDYTCPAGAYVYMTATGGNPGLAAGTNNPKIGLMVALGACSSLSPTTFISINEVSTVAAAYALAPFAASETLIGTSSTNVVGLVNAFGSIPNLVSPNGYSLLTTPAGNGTAPQAAMNTLADALAACINTTGTTQPCTSLMSAANVSGAGGTPVDTAQAAINIAQNPGVNVSAIYTLGTANGPYQPTLTAAPNDWTMQIQYTGGLNQVQGVSVDAKGNVFASNSLGANITEFSPNGVVLGTLTAPTLFRPQEMAIDLNGNLWVGSRQNVNVTPNTASSLIEFSPNGSLLSGVTGFTGGGLFTPRGAAIDTRGNVWLSGNAELSEFTSAGKPVSGTGGYTSPNLLAVILRSASTPGQRLGADDG